MFIQFYYLLPHPIHFETSGGFKTKLISTNTYVQGLVFIFLFFPQQFLLSFHHCTSVIPHKVHQSIEHFDLLLFTNIFGKTLINFQQYLNQPRDYLEIKHLRISKYFIAKKKKQEKKRKA